MRTVLLDFKWQIDWRKEIAKTIIIKIRSENTQIYLVSMCYKLTYSVDRSLNSFVPHYRSSVQSPGCRIRKSVAVCVCVIVYVCSSSSILLEIWKFHSSKLVFFSRYFFITLQNWTVFFLFSSLQDWIYNKIQI